MNILLIVMLVGLVLTCFLGYKMYRAEVGPENDDYTIAFIVSCLSTVLVGVVGVFL